MGTYLIITYEDIGRKLGWGDFVVSVEIVKNHIKVVSYNTIKELPISTIEKWIIVPNNTKITNVKKHPFIARAILVEFKPSNLLSFDELVFYPPVCL